MFEDDDDDAGSAGPSPRGVKHKRTSRVREGQIDALLSILETRPCLHSRKFTGLLGQENFESGWQEAAAELNKVPNGSIKSPEQWIKVWRDLKSKACSKAARLRKNRAQKGNRGVPAESLTEVEQRVISVVGGNYSYSTNCPDTMPEDDMLQSEIESAAEAPKIEFRSVTASPAPTARRDGSRNRNVNPRRTSQEQHNIAPQDYLAVAKTNAEAMKVLAASTKLQAEAAVQQAEAAKKQAEASLLFAQAADKIANALCSLADAWK